MCTDKIYCNRIEAYRVCVGCDITVLTSDGYLNFSWTNRIKVYTLDTGTCKVNDIH